MVILRLNLGQQIIHRGKKKEMIGMWRSKLRPWLLFIGSRTAKSR